MTRSRTRLGPAVLVRDGVFPFSGQVRRVNRHKAPIGGLLTATPVSCAALPLGLKSTAIGSLITFGSAATFLPFFLLTAAALIARLRGTWKPAGLVSFGRWGTPLNALAVLWTGLEVVNICWPRTILAPPGAPWYQAWAALIGVGLVTLVGLGYLVARRPQRLMRGPATEHPGTDELAPAVLWPTSRPTAPPPHARSLHASPSARRPGRGGAVGAGGMHGATTV
ncbi:amino acid permease [Kitasatospora sp. NPDC101155]|uniref:amino acid permease n=1 Tax=Kitasatospora sp. NPDC101155 TaxID=3364097 RepID=UPI0037F25EC3